MNHFRYPGEINTHSMPALPSPLLATKLFLPTPRPDLVPCPRLIEQLNTGLSCKLTIISALAGFGKSTLLSLWGQGAESRTQIAWLSLDNDNNDLTRFLTYFMAALQTVESNVGKGLLTALQSPGAVNIEVALLIIFWHPWLPVGVLIDVGVLIALLWAKWPPAAMIGS